MSVTNSPRLDLTRWSADSDPFTRSQLDTSHQRLEERAAGFFSGTDRSVRNPAVFVRSFFYDTDDGILYYSDGTQWQNLTEFGVTAAISANTPGNSAFEGDDDNAARADHVHAMPSWGDTGELAPIGTTAAQGNNAKFARINHVHVLGTDSVISGTIAENAISDPLSFVNGVVRTDAIDSQAVTKAKIHPDQQIPSGAIWAFGGITTPPTGWLFCNGASYSTSVYPDLFAVIGYSYGGSSGTFMVPNLCDCMPRGAGNVTTPLGAIAGADSVTIDANNLPNHTHGATGITVDSHPSHVHLLQGAGATTTTNNAPHVHYIPGQNTNGQLNNGTVLANSTYNSLFWGSSIPGHPNNEPAGTLKPNYFSGGGYEYPAGWTAGYVANTSVTTFNPARFTDGAADGAPHSHTLSGSTQGPSATLSHAVGGTTGNPTGTVGQEMSILPKTQTVNYIIKL